MQQYLIINGPNLNMLGRRNPAVYGGVSFEQYLLELREAFPDVRLTYLQSNHEGQLIDWLQQYGVKGTPDTVDGIILNAGGYTHTSVALRDAVELTDVPVVEIHISDITRREPFRRISLLTDVCAHTIIGAGLPGYAQAIQWLIGKQ